MEIRRNPTRSVRIGSISIGHEHPIAVQSMTATKTQDIDATVALVEQLRRAGADVVRIAVDSRKDAAALTRDDGHTRILMNAESMRRIGAGYAATLYDAAAALRGQGEPLAVFELEGRAGARPEGGSDA